MNTRVFVLLCLFVSGSVFAGDGMVKKASAYSVAETMDRLAKIVREKGFKVVARVNHGAAAGSVGTELRPTELLIFGNPAVGGKLMSSSQTAGLDLPVKALAWQDAEGTVWIAYNDPAWLAARHGIGDRAAVVAKMSGALGKFTDAAAGR